MMINHVKVLEELAAVSKPLSFNDIELFLMGFLRPAIGSNDFILFKRFVRLLRFLLGETPSVSDLRFLLALFGILVESPAGIESIVSAMVGKGVLELSQIRAFLDTASRCCVCVEGVLQDDGNVGDLESVLNGGVENDNNSGDNGNNSGDNGNNRDDNGNVNNTTENDNNATQNDNATNHPNNDTKATNTPHFSIDTLVNSLFPPTSKMEGDIATLLLIAKVTQKCGNCTNPAQFCQQFLSFLHQQNSPLFSLQTSSVNNWSNLIPHDETPVFQLTSSGRNTLFF